MLTSILERTCSLPYCKSHFNLLARIWKLSELIETEITKFSRSYFRSSAQQSQCRFGEFAVAILGSTSSSSSVLLDQVLMTWFDEVERMSSFEGFTLYLHTKERSASSKSRCTTETATLPCCLLHRHTHIQLHFNVQFPSVVNFDDNVDGENFIFFLLFTLLC